LFFAAKSNLKIHGINGVGCQHHTRINMLA